MRAMRAITRVSVLSFFFILLTSSTSNEFNLPVVVPDEEWQPLRDCVDLKLQSKLEQRLKQDKRWASLIRQHRMSVGLVDLTRPQAPRFAQVNGDTMLYAASLPKIAVLLAAFQAFDDGILKENPSIMRDLNDMIKHSGNASASRMIDRLGYHYIEKVLRAPEHRLFDPENGGGLWVGKRYARYGRRYPDPLKHLVHGASATQVCRFYYMLATGRLINPHRSRQMLEVLSEPAVHHKFVNALDGIAKNIRVYRKSGTWRIYHSDSALVWGPRWRRYILVALVADRHGERIMRELLPAMEEVLKERADSY